MDTLNDEQVDLSRVAWMFVPVGFGGFTSEDPLNVYLFVWVFAESHLGFVCEPDTIDIFLIQTVPVLGFNIAALVVMSGVATYSVSLRLGSNHTWLFSEWSFEDSSH